MKLIKFKLTELIVQSIFKEGNKFNCNSRKVHIFKETKESLKSRIKFKFYACIKIS